jgi:hypothetical protein
MKRSLLFLILVLWPACYSSAQQEKTLNIALIADKTGGLGQSPLISLLEVQLSKNGNIRLLERSQIDKILQEQQLSAAGLLDRNNTIKIGQLLGADALVIITLENEVKAITTGGVRSSTPVSTEVGDLEESGSTTENQATGDLIRVRIAETAHGLRLLDRFEQLVTAKAVAVAGLDSSELNEISERIVNDVKKAADKLSFPTGQLIPVGIVDIHRVQLGERYTMLERTLPKLLSIRLGIEPKIIMLEREDLKILQDEKLRTQGEDSKFWASAVLIEGNLQPKNGGLEMQLTLARPDGKDTKIIAVPVDPNEPSSAIDKAAANIVQEILNSPPSSQWQLAAEAEQFYQQGQMLAAHSRYDGAMPILETAHILQPRNIYYTEVLYEYEWNIRRKNENIMQSIFGKNGVESLKSYYSDLELAELVSVFVREIREEYQVKKLSARDIYFNWTFPNGPLDSGSMRVSYFANPASVSSEQVKQINRESRKIWVETFSTALKQQQLYNNDPQLNNRIRARLAWISSDDPNELILNLKKAFTEFMLPPEMGGQIKSTPERNYIYDQAFSTGRMLHSPDILDSSTHLKGVSDVFIRKWREYLSEQNKIDDPVVRFNTCLTLGDLIYYKVSEQERKKAKNYVFEAMKVLSEQLLKSNEPFCYYPHMSTKRIEQCINGLNLESVERVQAWTEFYEPLIEQKNVSLLSLLDPGLRQPYRSGSDGVRTLYYDSEAKQWYLVLERIAEVLQKSSSNNKQVTLALSRIRDKQSEIRKYYPEVGLSKDVVSLPVRMVLTKKDWFIPYVFHPIIFNRIGYIRYLNDKKNILWIGFCSRDDIKTSVGGAIEKSVNIGLVCMDMEKLEVTSLYQANIPVPYSMNDIGVTNITGIETINSKIYMSITNAGIIVFPTDSKQSREYLQTPKILTNKNGLPSVLISSITKEGNNLWVAYGYRRQESGLGLYDPETEKWESVFCSTLKTKSPFSSGNPYLIQNMRITKPDTLFFILNEPELGTSNMDKWSGLWKMNTSNRKVDFILGNNIFQKTGDFALEDFRDKWWLWQPDSSHIVEFDAISETYDFTGWDPYVNDHANMSSATIYKDTLWGRWGKNQLIKIKVGQKIQDAQIIDNNILDGGPVSRFVSTPYGLIAIGEGTVGLIETHFYF